MSSNYPVDSYYNTNRHVFTFKAILKPLQVLKDTDKILYFAMQILNYSAPIFSMFRFGGGNNAISKY